MSKVIVFVKAVGYKRRKGPSADHFDDSQLRAAPGVGEQPMQPMFVRPHEAASHAV